MIKAAHTEYALMKSPGYAVEFVGDTWLSSSARTHSVSTLSNEEWMAERLAHSVRLLKDSVGISHRVRSGVPVLRGTRMPLSRILAEISRSSFIDDFGKHWDLDVQHLRGFLDGLSIQLDRSFVR